MYTLNDITLEDIELKVKANDWREAIINCSKNFLERGIITQSYVDNMIKSVEEFGPYIVLSENFALAHARPEEGNKTGLFYATLETPVIFGVEEFDPVKLLVVLSASDSDSHLELLMGLAGILEDRELFEKLCNLDDKEEFLRLIKKAAEK